MADLLQQMGQWLSRELPSSEFLAIGSTAWWGFAALILLGRACDLGSTYLATPRLRLEGNPIARRLGWRGGIVLSLLAALLLGAWPLIAISVTTTSLLVAARNFQQAWLMRTMGEGPYQAWFAEQVWQSPRGLVLSCHWAEAVLSALPGLALVFWGDDTRVSLGIGLGFIVYGLVVAIFSTWVLWGLGRHQRLYRGLRREGPSTRRPEGDFGHGDELP